MKGRRSTKTTEQRIEDLKKACNRSGLTGPEIVEMLFNWQDWEHVHLEVTPFSDITFTKGQPPMKFKTHIQEQSK